MEPKDQDFIVSSLLSELKDENNRKDKVIKSLIKIICACLASILLTVAGFLWYLNQYDFTSTISNSAEGVYALIDSDGNVIGQDITPEQLDKILEVLNNGQSNADSNE